MALSYSNGCRSTLDGGYRTCSCDRSHVSYMSWKRMPRKVSVSVTVSLQISSCKSALVGIIPFPIVFLNFNVLVTTISNIPGEAAGGLDGISSLKRNAQLMTKFFPLLGKFPFTPETRRCFLSVG